MKKDQFLHGNSINSFLRMDKVSGLIMEAYLNKKRTIVVLDPLYNFIIEHNLSLVEKDYYTIRKLRIIPISEYTTKNINYIDSKKLYLYGDTDILMQLRLEKG